MLTNAVPSTEGRRPQGWTSTAPNLTLQVFKAPRLLVRTESDTRELENNKRFVPLSFEIPSVVSAVVTYVTAKRPGVKPALSTLLAVLADSWRYVSSRGCSK
jgi:hypothetical protein